MVFSIAFFVSLLRTVNCKAIGVSADISALPSTLLGYEGVSHYNLRYDGSIPCNMVTLRFTLKD